MLTAFAGVLLTFLMASRYAEGREREGCSWIGECGGGFSGGGILERVRRGEGGPYARQW